MKTQVTHFVLKLKAAAPTLSQTVVCFHQAAPWSKSLKQTNTPVSYRFASEIQKQI